MDIPEDIETERVHAESLAHFDALFPVGAGDARIVHLSCLNHKRPAVEEESAFSHCEITTAFRCMAGEGAQHHDQCEHEKKNLLL